MIDVESEVFGELDEYLRGSFPDIHTSSEENRSPAKFPFVSAVEADSTTRTDTSDSGSIENHVNVMFEINVYTNKSSGSKSQAKEIFAAVDTWFLRHGFVRTMKNPVNMDDATKYRITARYSGSVSKDMKVYRR